MLVEWWNGRGQKVQTVELYSFMAKPGLALAT